MEYRGIGISGNRDIVESRNRRRIEECENENGEWSRVRIRKGNRAMGEWGNEDSLKRGISTDKRVRIFQFRTESCFSGILSHVSTLSEQVQIQLRNLFIVIPLQVKAHRFSRIMGRFKSRFSLFEIRYTGRRRIEPPGWIHVNSGL